MPYNKNEISVSRAVNCASIGPQSLNVARKRLSERKLPCKKERSAVKISY